MYVKCKARSIYCKNGGVPIPNEMVDAGGAD